MLRRHKMSLLSRSCTCALLFLCFALTVLSETSVFEQLASFVGSLCSLNEDGEFGDCCKNKNNGADISSLSDESGIPSCFFNLQMDEGQISILFVFSSLCLFCFTPFFKVIFQKKVLHSSEVVSFPVSLFSILFNLALVLCFLLYFSKP